jgi:hypothetical protein
LLPSQQKSAACLTLRAQRHLNFTGVSFNNTPGI